MGASDPEAVEWLAKQPGFTIKVSYDTSRTRLHAKAYHFQRKTGFSSAYIGSANMSHAAMTSGLEWTMKVTSQDMPHILDRFGAEFESYWSSDEFALYTQGETRLKEAIQSFKLKDKNDAGTRFFADIKPYSFQERILESLQVSRQNGFQRNLVVAATGTGKTVIAALDYAQNSKQHPLCRLLFVAHRKEILYQARDCFRAVLKEYNFGEMLVDGKVPIDWQYVFASVSSLANRKPWDNLGESYYDVVILDEAHHGKASSYRPILDNLKPKVLLGLTATPERMDGKSLLPDFDNRFAAEIRLPEALEERLLCPFHYFGITDPVAISGAQFWKNGKYDNNALTEVYTGDDILARQRLDVIVKSLNTYQPNLENTYAVGFCVSVDHAKFMSKKFNEIGYVSDVVLGETDDRAECIQRFRKGEITFLFTVDVFNEGIDIPEINLVLFLRPTQSLTVFLQQLGRGLRHFPEKDCLTVLDFVGQYHDKYRIDRKFSALLRNKRRRIEKEVENDFPNLPPGCNIHLERVAKENILSNIKKTLGNLNTFIPEAIKTFEQETDKPLTFGNFIEETGLSPVEILKKKTWSSWKRLSNGIVDSELDGQMDLRKSFCRIVLRTDPICLDKLDRLSMTEKLDEHHMSNYSPAELASLHYLFWGKNGEKAGVSSYQDSLSTWCAIPDAKTDLKELVGWRRTKQSFATHKEILFNGATIHLHAEYGLREINAMFGLANLEKSGPTGTGVIPIKEHKHYLHLVTFRKEEKDFAPTTRYKDYLINRTHLHWETQASTTQLSGPGQNYIHFKERGYTILFFARINKKTPCGETSPFLYLGPASDLISYENNRPISMTWKLKEAVPAAFYEMARIV